VKVALAKSAGFCFGVSRAVKMIEGLFEKGETVSTLGPVIHNPRFVKTLESRGATVIDSLRQARSGSVVVIRSHGVAPEVYREIENLGLRCCDATCPYVAKIHQIVADASRGGATVLIAGDPAHPEVEGIRGHCTGGVFVFKNLDELKALADTNQSLHQTKIIAVAQTTFNADDWRDCNNFLKKVYTNAIIFDTICSATSIRQQEARELALRSDIMIIVGGRQSSNTQKLYSICSEICPSFLVEGADDLPRDVLKKAVYVGVTAGASTPVCIIKEVLNNMSGIDNIEAEDVDFAAALEKSFKMIRTDERVRGIVASVSANEIQVDLGTKHAGYVPLAELSDDPSVKPDQLYKVGDEIDLLVLRVNDQDGTVMLSKKRVDALHNWDLIVKANEDDTTMTGVITEVIKGGVLASVGGVKLFIPASQTGVPKDGQLETLLRKTVNLKIIEINEDRRRAVGSIRAVQREEKKALSEKFWADVEIGQEYTGKVKSMTAYGAFIDLGGVDGMIHVSELSWSRIKNPSEVLSIGETVKVIVKDVNKETKKVSLTYKDKGEDPWTSFIQKFHVDDIIEVKIVSFMPFGCFAQIIPGVDGLIHISHISDKRITRPQEVLQMGEMVKVKIIEINEEKKRISLSIKEALEGGNAQADELGENTEPQPEEVHPEEAHLEEPAVEKADELGENS
jgi:(E)-4-hydroxy-3-methyl-but-2-enyl pyrophosphate reductase